MSYSLFAFWKPRPESADACARQLVLMFAHLASIHPVFARWRRQAETEKDAQVPFCTMPPYFEELRNVIADKVQKDDAGQPWPELGYSFSAWNELDEFHGLFFHAKVGAADMTLPEPNSIFFQLGNPRPENQDFLNASILTQMLIAVSESWNADWGVVEPWAYDRKLKDAKGHLLRPWGGWLTYLSPAYAREISPPPSARSERLPSGALLIKATDEQFSANNPTHIVVADAVQACLKPLQSNPEIQVRILPRPNGAP